jgi:hypothetical protein
MNRLVDLDEIIYCKNGIKSDLDYSKMAIRLRVRNITFEQLGRFP